MNGGNYRKLLVTTDSVSEVANKLSYYSGISPQLNVRNF